MEKRNIRLRDKNVGFREENRRFRGRGLTPGEDALAREGKKELINVGEDGKSHLFFKIFPSAGNLVIAHAKNRCVCFIVDSASTAVKSLDSYSIRFLRAITRLK